MSKIKDSKEIYFCKLFININSEFFINDDAFS